MESTREPEAKSKKENLGKKRLVITKTLPPVRQTITSYKRMLNANPLLKYQEAGIDIHNIMAQRPSTSQTDSTRFKKSASVIPIRKLPVNIPKVKEKVISVPKATKKPEKLGSENLKSKIKADSNYKKQKSSLRKSLSAGDIPVKNVYNFDTRRAYTKINHAQSQEGLYAPLSNNFKDLSPIKNTKERDFVFKTPSAYDRRSICHTPHSNRRSTLFTASTPASAEMLKLEERLNIWLKSRGKPPAYFNHLRVFGTKANKAELSLIKDEENKENVEVNGEKSESYESLQILTTPDLKDAKNETEETKGKMTEEDLIKHAKEAMMELLKLIEEGYPRNQCLEWLELIKDKYRKTEDEPEYWECRAAIEQSAGNVNNAVEFYKTAIIQGAEINAVDQSLDQLLKKFSLLSITPKQNAEKSNTDRERIVKEARNVFKSSIIQFAIRERNTRKAKDNVVSPSAQMPTKRLIAIPVRRSTRLSPSSQKTPGLKLCTSLRELDLTLENISFEKNKALC